MWAAGRWTATAAGSASEQPAPEQAFFASHLLFSLHRLIGRHRLCYIRAQLSPAMDSSQAAELAIIIICSCLLLAYNALYFLPHLRFRLGRRR